MLILFAFGLGYLLNPTFQTSNLRTLLSVMIGAQASILAIIISVTLISTQLVATRYAPRMATLPFRTLLFKGTFLLFAASIILDVLLLVSVTPASRPIYNGGLFVAIGLFFGVLLFLYTFVRGMVAHTSPENLVTLFTETISADEYLSGAQALEDAPDKNAHPLQPLYRFIMTALSRNEHGTARSAFDQYQKYSSQMMGELDALGIFDDNSIDCGKQLFGPVLTEHLHLITIHAAEKDESQILASAVDTQVDLGKQGMEIGSGIQIPGQALMGIRRTIIEMPVSSDDYMTFNRAWPAVAELMLEEVQHDHHRVLLSGKNLINGRLAASLYQSNEPQWHTDSLRRFFEDICEAHIWALKKIAYIPGFFYIDLDSDASLRDCPLSGFVQQVQYSRDAIIEATSTFLQFRIDEELWPITEGNFRSEWKQLCISAASCGAEDHSVWLCQALIEMAFLENINRPYEETTSWPFTRDEDDDQDTDYLFWVRELATIYEETSGSILERAFDNILQYDYQEGPTPLRVAGYSELEEQYYYPILYQQNYRALNTYSQFPELLQELREQSLRE